MAITAAMVKELREVSGAGMMDCKKALTATEGDMDKAMEFLREKGLATAQKKAGRIAAEGIVMLNVSEDGKKAVAVEVNAETDFVAKNEKFRGYVAQVAEQAMDTTAADVEGFLEKMIKTAHVISDTSKDDEVGINNTVQVYIEEDDETETYKLVTTVRGNSLKGYVSIDSPLGKAILGHKVGDRVTVKVSDAYSYDLIIKSIENTADTDDELRSY